MSAQSNVVFEKALEFFLLNLPAHFHPPNVKVGIICGSGLGGIVDTIDVATKVEFPYEKIPGFAVSTDKVEKPHLKLVGHTGKLVFGLLGEHRTPTVCMVGRFHFYEGHNLSQVTLPVRIMKLLGVQNLIGKQPSCLLGIKFRKVVEVTNAAGGLNPVFKVGDIMVINDHISLPGLAGNSPLVGPNLDKFGPRFPPTSDAYTYSLRKLAFRAALATGFPRDSIREGVYTFVSGPSYETRAEARYLRSLGGDAVGMSTAPEVVVARHCGIKVLGLSLVTNAVVTKRGKDAFKEVLREAGEHVEDFEEDTDTIVASHEEVLATSAMRAEQLQSLVRKVVDLLGNE
ncbi:nucleoside phosphorylase domain-containing protein [Jimgerdemannia flammicorona]|uniref:purine-nucleoside phosphorylase n=1 Tax=Jimgerdemannia flammicorona TaxID=994334 RepID=A0A433DJ15_9FUNG|nr:nucleoside phosphorylase domain-containing protein [Jimgerdemannia flammicorona]